MRNHTDLLNYLAQKLDAKRYLEIGVQNPAANFDKIKVPLKVGVDPDPTARATFTLTSDAYFALLKPEQPFDLIFIDGLHHEDQVERDFDHALEQLSDRGVIVLHDTMPLREDETHVPRDKKGRWLGDVYKFAARLCEYQGLNYVTVSFDNGCTVVWHQASMRGTIAPHITYHNHRLHLRLITPEKIRSMLG